MERHEKALTFVQRKYIVFEIIDDGDNAVLLGCCSGIPRIETRCGKWSLLLSKILGFCEQNKKWDNKKIGNFAKSRLNTW